MTRAPLWCMPPARHYSDLTVWKLADQLRVKVFALTSTPKFARDLKAQGQADDAINSVCRNIAEGFACESHAEFARFLEFSRRSLNEVQDAMRGAQLKGYVSATDLDDIRKLSVRLYPALSRFITYLRRTPQPPKRRTRNRTNPRKPDHTDQRKKDRTD
jgi:four helix bundle protein